jgi:hypothetical protein
MLLAIAHSMQNHLRRSMYFLLIGGCHIQISAAIPISLEPQNEKCKRLKQADSLHGCLVQFPHPTVPSECKRAELLDTG